MIHNKDGQPYTVTFRMNDDTVIGEYAGGPATVLMRENLCGPNRELIYYWRDMGLATSETWRNIVMDALYKFAKEHWPATKTGAAQDDGAKALHAQEGK